MWRMGYSERRAPASGSTIFGRPPHSDALSACALPERVHRFGNRSVIKVAILPTNIGSIQRSSWGQPTSSGRMRVPNREYQ